METHNYVDDETSSEEHKKICLSLQLSDFAILLTYLKPLFRKHVALPWTRI